MMSNENRIFEFKYVNWLLGVFGSLTVGALFAYITVMLEPAMDAFLRQLPNGVDEVVFIIFFFGVTLTLILTSFALTERKGKATLHKSHLELELRGKHYHIPYKDIVNTNHYYSWQILMHKGKGKNIYIYPSPRFVFRDPLTKFMTALQKEVDKNRSGPQRIRRKMRR